MNLICEGSDKWKYFLSLYIWLRDCTWSTECLGEIQNHYRKVQSDHKHLQNHYREMQNNYKETQNDHKEAKRTQLDLAISGRSVEELAWAMAGVVVGCTGSMGEIGGGYTLCWWVVPLWISLCKCNKFISVIMEWIRRHRQTVIKTILITLYLQ